MDTKTIIMNVFIKMIKKEEKYIKYHSDGNVNYNYFYKDGINIE